MFQGVRILSFYDDFLIALFTIQLTRVDRPYNHVFILHVTVY